ncbi:MAG: RNA methyltransferase [Phycisphaeraceae bacterium]|nr:RNA methyltransferase [Phycisphaeraceae bacterium]
MPVEVIDDLNDPRLAAFRSLKGRDAPAGCGRFIAEGHWLAQRLFAARLEAELVLTSRKRRDEVLAFVPDHTLVLEVPDDFVRKIVGYEFHSGVLAYGIRPQPLSLSDITSHWPDRATLLVLPKVISNENLGALYRIAGAFGVTAVLLGKSACDPWSRRALRVSMGAVFRMPTVMCDDLPADLRRLREEHGVQSAATVLKPGAIPLSQTKHPGRLALLMGPEDQGLEDAWIDACDLPVTIPMSMGTDSLNVAVAAAVCLYHFTQGGGIERENAGFTKSGSDESQHDPSRIL